MQTFDAKGNKLDDSIFAQAYRATIPGLAPAKFVTVRANPSRMSELSMVSTDISDVIEGGIASDKKTRVIAAPASVHIDDGAELVPDSTMDPSQVLFCVNGIPTVGIINLMLNASEQAAAAKAARDAAAKVQAAETDSLKVAQAVAFEEGKKQALLDQAKAAGAASVAKTEEPNKVQ